jgi:hypothetical protein
MKYFTADLYERFNSRDVDVADRADDEWRKAEARYEARLQRIRGGLPEAVRELADELCLHDAEIMAIGHNDARASIVVRQGSSLYWLSYGLSRAMESTRSRRAAAFSREPVVWLYDEVECRRPVAMCTGSCSDIGPWKCGARKRTGRWIAQLPAPMATKRPHGNERPGEVVSVRQRGEDKCFVYAIGLRRRARGRDRIRDPGMKPAHRGLRSMPGCSSTPMRISHSPW